MGHYFFLGFDRNMNADPKTWASSDGCRVISPKPANTNLAQAEEIASSHAFASQTQPKDLLWIGKGHRPSLKILSIGGMCLPSHANQPGVCKALERVIAHHKKLIAMALTKWRKFASIGRGPISLPRIWNKLAKKGHFVVYTTDRKRFVVPLAYLRCNIFRELLRMSEEVFGLPGDGPITLPCSATFMEYVLSTVQRTFSDKDSRQGIAFVFGM